MAKDFFESFKEWKEDKRYEIGEDIGWEKPHSGSTPEERSSTQDNGKSHPTEEVLTDREKA
jgi:hypothetical protein